MFNGYSVLEFLDEFFLLFHFLIFQGERICSQGQMGSGAEVAKLTPVTKH